MGYSKDSEGVIVKNEYGVIDVDNPIYIEIINNGEPSSIQNPNPSDGDSVYEKDIWVDESISTNWTDVDSTGKDIITIPFTNLHTRIRNSTSDNPKILRVHFNRTISAHQVGLGAIGGGDYSNVKVSLLGSGEVPRTVLDDSSNNTKYTSNNYEFEPQLFNALQLEFYTSDTVDISNITIQKAMEVNSFIKIQKPDGSIVAAQGTTKGNFKVSIEEVDDSASEYNTNDIDEASSTVTYIGMENKGNLWYIKKIDTTTGCIFSHATINNNSGYATYDLAWTARASLVYENYGDAF